MTVEDDRIEHAARAAWETFSTEVGHDSELWRHQNHERQERWRKIARAVLQYVEPTEEVKRLESQLAGLRRAYDHERLQAEKYMRRAIEWRDAALNGTAVTITCTGCGSCNVCRKKTDEPYRGPLATQGPNDNCTSGCHNYAWHCGRCGGCTGYQGHHWSHCKVTGTVREFHMCCPDDCELSAADEGQR